VRERAGRPPPPPARPAGYLTVKVPFIEDSWGSQ
jgi:hypothetical protein